MFVFIWCCSLGLFTSYQTVLYTKNNVTVCYYVTLTMTCLSQIVLNYHQIDTNHNKGEDDTMY